MLLASLGVKNTLAMVHCEVPWQPAQPLASNRCRPSARRRRPRGWWARGARAPTARSRRSSSQSDSTLRGAATPEGMSEMVEPLSPAWGVAVACWPGAGGVPSKAIRSAFESGGPAACTMAPTPARVAAGVELEVVDLVEDAGPVEHPPAAGIARVVAAIEGGGLAGPAGEEPGDVVGEAVGVAALAGVPGLAVERPAAQAGDEELLARGWPAVSTPGGGRVGAATALTTDWVRERDHRQVAAVLVERQGEGQLGRVGVGRGDADGQLARRRRRRRASG